MNRIWILLFLSLVCTGNAFGQIEMADKMRSEGKIYVVVGIILIVLAGFIVYLISMDKKIKRLERLLNEKQGQTK
jgi:hypothetical protein